MLLVAGCGRNPSEPADLSIGAGSFAGANGVASVEVTLSRGGTDEACFLRRRPDFLRTPETVFIEGTYRNLTTDESVLVCSDMERRADRLVTFTLFMGDNGASGPAKVYHRRDFSGQAADSATIRGTLATWYTRTSVSGGTWTSILSVADSSALTLRRR